jgi:DNA-binding NtrC family response regulator
MSTLIADRFLVCGTATTTEDLCIAAIDLSSGERVGLKVLPAGVPAEQQSWADACARAHAEGRLIDFGLVGTTHKFEVAARTGFSRRALVHPSDSLLEWIEHARPSSARIVYVDELPDARQLRLRGFVPCELSLLQDTAQSVLVWTALARRSVVLLDRHDCREGIALVVLRLHRLRARDVCVISQRRPAKRSYSSHAAEGRAVYGRRPCAPDVHITHMMADSQRMLQRGRHSAAERALRALAGALDRRGDWTRAGDSSLALGRLLLARGRAADAKTVFEDAHNYFQRGSAAAQAIDATVYVGLAQTDLGSLPEACETCRAAYSAAVALHRPDSVLFAGVGLVRSLFWHERYGDARSIVDAITPSGNPDHAARYWCLVARLAIAANALPEARQAIERARPMACGASPEIESTIRLCEAQIQARLGDLEALRVHVAAGMAAARAARLPLQSIRLQLAEVEGLMTAERSGGARLAAKRLESVMQRAIPPLLKSRIATVLKRLDHVPVAREAVPRFHAGHAGSAVAELDGLRDLLTLSHGPDDEADALSRAAAAIRKTTHAAGVGIFGSKTGAAKLITASGSSSEPMAQRALNIGQPIVPLQTAAWIEAAVPIQYLGRYIGAIALRWNIEGPESIERALAFAAAAAAACAPLVYVLVQRQTVPASDDSTHDLIGVSPAIDEVRRAISRAANAPFTVLVEGESGAGKELVARAIHRAGCRRERRFCALNCAAMPEDLVDAELFGHARGAFTGAAGERLGLFESADGGTVFLDEIGELSSRAQAKVLRVLQEGEVRRIGEHFTRPFDARLVAATNRSLRAEVEARRFRQDLFYRLDVIRINVPPLRDRPEDVPLLAERFWKQAAERIGSRAVLAHSALSTLARYDWPGNVRELQNVLAALVVAAPARGVVGASQLPAAIAQAAQPAANESLERARLKFEQRFVRAALARAAGHRGQTAAALGLSRQGLAKLIQRLQLDA